MSQICDTLEWFCGWLDIFKSQAFDTIASLYYGNATMKPPALPLRPHPINVSLRISKKTSVSHVVTDFGLRPFLFRVQISACHRSCKAKDEWEETLPHNLPTVSFNILQRLLYFLDTHGSPHRHTICFLRTHQLFH